MICDYPWRGALDSARTREATGNKSARRVLTIPLTVNCFPHKPTRISSKDSLHARASSSCKCVVPHSRVLLLVTEESLNVFFGGKSKLSVSLFLSRSLLARLEILIQTSVVFACGESRVTLMGAVVQSPILLAIYVCSFGTAAAAASKNIDALSPSDAAIETTTTTTTHTRECVYTRVV
jgi:hypothetical protein